MYKHVQGLDVVLEGLDQFGVDVHEAAYYAVVEVLQKAYRACYDLLSEHDHTLADLMHLGGPYGFTHPAQIHDPDVEVHVQSGEYRAALRAVPPIGLSEAIMEGRIDLGDDPRVQQLDRWIQDGTLKMRARPWMEWIMQTYGEDFATLLEARLTEAIHAAASGSPMSA